MHKRGRPKGSEKTVIGLPRKKPKKGKGKYSSLPFIKKHPTEKEGSKNVHVKKSVHDNWFYHLGHKTLSYKSTVRLTKHDQLLLTSYSKKPY